MFVALSVLGGVGTVLLYGPSCPCVVCLFDTFIELSKYLTHWLDVVR